MIMLSCILDNNDNVVRYPDNNDNVVRDPDNNNNVVRYPGY